MEVLWTEPAEAHLAAIHSYLSRTSGPYADRMVDRITRRTLQLMEFPRSGAVVDRAEPLEIRMILEGPYRILYVVAIDHIGILGVLHGSRDTI